MVRLGQNCSARKLCYFLPKTPPKSFFQNTCLRSIFSYEIAPSPIFGAKLDYVARWGRNCSGRKLCYYLPKMPLKLFFPKNTFLVHIFFMKSLPYLFLGPNGLCDVFGGKIVLDENFATFWLKRPRNCFSKKLVSDPIFFTKSLPYLFLGPNGLCGVFEGKIV